MIVDDEPDVLESLKTVLENEKYHVVLAENGERCLELLESGFKGVILMDIMMPGMDGFDTIKEIVSRGYISNVVIEVVTGMAIKDAKSMGVMEPYVHDYISKPIDIGQLIHSVEKCNLFLSAKEKNE